MELVLAHLLLHMILHPISHSFSKIQNLKEKLVIWVALELNSRKVES
jgi:hypothetical protein